MNISTFLRPNKLTLALVILFGLLSWLLPYGIEPTTKITWDEYRGFPLSFIKLTGCSGPCYTQNFGYRYFVQEFELPIFVLDALIWYVMACFIAYGLSIFPRGGKVKEIVADKK